MRVNYLVVALGNILLILYLFATNRFELNVGLMLTVGQIAASICLVYMHNQHAKKSLSMLSGLGAFPSGHRHGSMIQALEKIESELDKTLDIVTGLDVSNTVDLPIQNGQLKAIISAAQKKVIETKAQDSKKQWINEGLVYITDFEFDAHKINSFTNEFIRRIVSYFKINLGLLYLSEEQDGNTKLVLKSTFPFVPEDFRVQSVSLGEGTVGQSYFEKQVLLVRNLPVDYVKISSGLGSSPPWGVYVVPIVWHERVYGVLELPVLDSFDEAKKELLSKVTDRLAFNLATIQNNLRTAALLNQSQVLMKDLQMHKHELEDNMARMGIVYTRMQAKQTELESVLEQQATLELSSKGIVSTANAVFLSITGYKESEIVGNVFTEFVAKHDKELAQFNMMWESILGGNSFSGEFRIKAVHGLATWLVGNFIPIKNHQGEVTKVIATFFGTKDKNRIDELKTLVNALKACMPMAEISPDMRINDANELFLQETGLARLNLKGTKSDTFLSSDSIDRLESQLIAQDKALSEIILELKRRDGSLRKFRAALISYKALDLDRRMLVFSQQIDS